MIELSGGNVIAVGQVTADVTEEAKRRIQIREVIRAHLDKERELFPLGIKVLSLFFIDEVARYRDYRRADTRGEYARIFAEEYAEQVNDLLGELAADGDAAGYRAYLAAIPVESTHRGYFSVDKKTGRVIDGDLGRTGDERGQSTDADAYDLILRDKERLLSLGEPARFIFSHSALREGWDNPNVFVLGMLKRSDSTVSRRQEIGRGLRLCVNQLGDRVDDPATVHEVNELTVVTDESYTAFVDGLQRELSESPGAGPREAGGDRPGYPRPADGRRRERAARRGESPGTGQAARPVAFDSGDLIASCVTALDASLKVDALRYVVQRGEQRPPPGSGAVTASAGFTATGTSAHAAGGPAASQVRYDLLGEMAGQDTAHPADHRHDLVPDQPGHLRAVPAEPRPVHHRVCPPDQRPPDQARRGTSGEIARPAWRRPRGSTAGYPVSSAAGSTGAPRPATGPGGAGTRIPLAAA